MNAIEEVDEQSRTITVQAGAILEQATDAADDKNLFYRLVLVLKDLHKWVA